MSNHNSEIEESLHLRLDFQKLSKISHLPVIPAVAQDIDSKEILIIGYVDETALLKAQQIQKVVFYSTSRKSLWIKGETSGDYLQLIEILVNCEQNSLVYLCRPLGKDKGACHTKDLQGKSRLSCFYRKVVGQNQLEMLSPNRKTALRNFNS